MFIRATIGKFPSKLKADMYLAYIKTEVLPKLKKNLKLLVLEL